MKIRNKNQRSDTNDGTPNAPNGGLKWSRTSRFFSVATLLLLSGTIILASESAPAAVDGQDEFSIKREEIYSFKEIPVIARDGDQVIISFETTAFCDVTVAIENVSDTANSSSKIVRHLASGVLGDKAPAPLQKGSRKQRLIWDGKDDYGRYVDDTDNLIVRVSLGLNPKLERTLLWCPTRIISNRAPLLASTKEGVLVFDGCGIDSLLLFSREGKYLRTIYPFSMADAKTLKGTETDVYPQDSVAIPRKYGHYQATFLSSGDSGNLGKGYPHGLDGRAATSIAFCGNNIALVGQRLCRLALDNSNGTLPLNGPDTCFKLEESDWRMRSARGGDYDEFSQPISAAFSPDGRRLYLTGFRDKRSPPESSAGRFSFYLFRKGVAYLDYPSGKTMNAFAGDLPDLGNSTASPEVNLETPCAVACDSSGRVYVADNSRHRIFIFSSEGKYLRNLEVEYPAQISIHHATGEIYVSQFPVPNIQISKTISFDPRLSKFGPFDHPSLKTTYRLPFGKLQGLHYYRGEGRLFQMALDSRCTPPRIWLSSEKDSSIRIFTEKENSLEQIRSFEDETSKILTYTRPPSGFRQRLYVHPKTGELYIGYGIQGFSQLLRVNPITGIQEMIKLPFTAEDFTFDPEGRAYLRSRYEIVRYDPDSWREIPFDYGEERSSVGLGSIDEKRTSNAMGAIPINGINWHMAGLAVSFDGAIAAPWYVGNPPEARSGPKQALEVGNSFTPSIYPGRMMYYKMPLIFLWDRFGQKMIADAVPGLGYAHGGIGMDREHNLYIMTGSQRLNNGKPYFYKGAGTLVKVIPGRTKIFSSNPNAPVRLEDATSTSGKPQIADKFLVQAWVENCAWYYGGVGQNVSNLGFCSCSNSQFAFDYFARSFVPEIGHHSVAVLDSSGNLILRIGRLGNVDDGRPAVMDGGPGTARGVGGDEVSLMYAPYLGVQTDRRLFIADIGNQRILSVTLGYFTQHQISLKRSR